MGTGRRRTRARHAGRQVVGGRLGPARLTCGRCAARRGCPGAAQCGGGEEKRGEAKRGRPGPGRSEYPHGGQAGASSGEPRRGLPPSSAAAGASPAEAVAPPSCPAHPPSSPGQPSVRRASGAGMAGGRKPPVSPVAAEATQKGAGRYEASRGGLLGFLPPWVSAALSRSGSHRKLSKRAPTLRATLSFCINFPSRPMLRHVVHPPNRNLRSVEYGVGLIRLVVRLSTHALRFPEELEYFFCIWLHLLGYPMYLAGFCNAGCRPRDGRVWPGLDSSAAFKTCLPCLPVKMQHFGG